MDGEVRGHILGIGIGICRFWSWVGQSGNKPNADAKATYLLLGSSVLRSLLRAPGSNAFASFSGRFDVDNELLGSRSSTPDAAEDEALRRWKGRCDERDGANTRGSTLAQHRDVSWSAILMCAGDRR